jgi:hypothetical protein
MLITNSCNICVEPTTFGEASDPDIIAPAFKILQLLDQGDHAARKDLFSAGRGSLIYIRNGIHQIVIRTLSIFRYLCPQLAYLVLSRIFLIATKNGELSGSYWNILLSQ